MSRLHFNTAEGSKERSETQPLTLEEENEVIKVLEGVEFYWTKEELDKVQRFLNHYQNLSHFSAVNCDRA